MDIYNLVSFGGIFVLLGVAWLLSAEKRNMNWRVIVWGVGLQLLIGLFIFIVPAGAQVFRVVNDVVIEILDSASAGAQFVFGRLAIPPGQESETGEKSLGPILAFQAFPTIIFFSALIAILYHFKIMPLIIRAFAYVFTRLMRISGAESLVAASNIFVGIESSLTVRPYLGAMTRSELHGYGGLQCSGAVRAEPGASIPQDCRSFGFGFSAFRSGGAGHVENYLA
jgi:CNT family concentrative nucleoside transporter